MDADQPAIVGELVPYPADDQNDEHVRAWALAATFIGVAGTRNTKDAYRRDLFGCACEWPACDHPDPKKQPNPLAWLRWLTGRRINPFQVRAAIVELWIADLSAAGYAEGSRARKLSTVSAWYQWLFREDQVPFNPVGKLHRRPKFRERGTAGTALPHQHAMALMDQADSDGPRSAALVALGLYQGMRVSDIVNLNVEGYRPGPSGGNELTYVAKGGKTVRVELVPVVDERVQAWLAARTALLGADRLPTRTAGGAGPQPMFTTRAGGRMSRRQMYRIVVRLAQQAGVPVHVSPHDLRRTFGTQASAEGADIVAIQQDMGHAFVTTTQGYIRRPKGSHAGNLIAAAHARLREEAARRGEQQEEIC